MPKALLSDTLTAAIRSHFGLSQDDLARFLGVTRMLVSHLEAGRRQSTPVISRRLARLAALLPPPTGHGPAAPHFSAVESPPTPSFALPDVGDELASAPLRRRLLQVKAQAARLRWELHRAGKGAVLQQRREWGLAQLQAALPPAELTDEAELARISRWLTVLAADVHAAASTPATRAAQALAVVRLLVLDAETAMLLQLADGNKNTPGEGD